MLVKRLSTADLSPCQGVYSNNVVAAEKRKSCTSKVK